MKLIAQGAEAKLYVSDITEAPIDNICAEDIEKEKVLIKKRIKKSYRIQEIDNKLRKQRTKTEAKLLSEARRAGVNTPLIFEVKENEIIMEFIEGERIKEFINSIITGSSCYKHIEKIAEQIGISIAKLHNQDIIHGDLTTSNMIYNISERSIGNIIRKQKSLQKNSKMSAKNNNISELTKEKIDALPLRSGSAPCEHILKLKNKIFFIDFGLGFFSKKIEDKASDLSVLKEAIKSTHFKHLNILWKSIIKGYKQNKQWKEVLNCLEKIEKRGRYTKR